MTLLKGRLRILRRTEGERSIETGRALCTIGGVHQCRQGKLEDALVKPDEAHSIMKENVGLDHPEMGDILQAMGSCYHGTGRLDEALSAFEKALQIKCKAHATY